MCQKQIEDLILDLTGRLELSTEEIKQLQEAGERLATIGETNHERI